MNIKPVLGGIAFGVFGLWMMKSSLKSLRQYKSSLNWSETKGKILKSEAVRFKTTSNQTSFFVEYEYTAGNRTLKGTRAVLWPMVTNGQALEFEKKFTPDSVVRVFYDPGAPTESVLIKGPPQDGKIYGGIILSGLATFIGFALSIAGYLGVLN